MQQDSEPFLSILMPCYNASEYIDEAITSLLNQTFHPFTLIIVDDGSTDNSPDILQKYANADSRIRLIVDTENKGIIFRRNQLLDLCETKLACWADADDIYLPTRLEKQYEFLMNNSDIAMCTCNYAKFQHGMNKTPVIHSQDAISSETLIFYNNILNPGAMFRIDLVKQNQIRFDNTISGASDYKFWVELNQVAPFYQIQETLVEYRIHNAQESTAQLQRQLKGHIETVHFSLLLRGVELDHDSIAELLIFPLEKLGGSISGRQSRKALKNIDLLLKTLSVDSSEQLKQVLLIITRAHCKRLGVSSFWFLITRFKWFGLSRCHWFGFELFYKTLQHTMKNRHGKSASAEC